MSRYSERFMYDFIHEGKNYGIIVDFFSALVESIRFRDVMDNMSKDMGYNTNISGCCFASSCDEEDIENGDYFEDGVMFYLNEEDVIVDYQTFYNCLKLGCDIYLEMYPNDKQEIETKLKIIQSRYNVL